MCALGISNSDKNMQPREREREERGECERKKCNNHKAMTQTRTKKCTLQCIEPGNTHPGIWLIRAKWENTTVQYIVCIYVCNALKMCLCACFFFVLFGLVWCGIVCVRFILALFWFNFVFRLKWKRIKNIVFQNIPANKALYCILYE